MDKKFKNVTVNPRANENVFNSTAKFNDFALLDDLSTISSITGSTNFDLNNELAIYGRDGNKVASSNSVSADEKAQELDNIYAQYLMVLYMKENMKKSFKDEEEHLMKELHDLYVQEQNIKRESNELEKEIQNKESLTQLLDFMEALEGPVRKILEKEESFRRNYEKLAKICENAQNCMKTYNINLNKEKNIEQTLSFELNKAISVLKRVIELCNSTYKLNSVENIENCQIDFKLFNELLIQHGQLKSLILTQSGFKVMNAINNQ